MLSQWKILDNLRRSLVEPITFLILVLGYFIFPKGPLYWTIVTLVLMLLPSLAQLALDIAKALFKFDVAGLRGAFSAWEGQVAFATSDQTTPLDPGQTAYPAWTELTTPPTRRVSAFFMRAVTTPSNGA